MSLARVTEIAEKTPKGKLLATLAEHHLAEERAMEETATARPTAPARPSANPLADCPENLLRQRASHRSSPPADSALAIVELKRRGIIYANGIFTQSNRSK
jgi:hypothetical protein